MAILGAQSAITSALELRAAVRRGTMSGTATTPAARQPKNATTKSSPGGNRNRRGHRDGLPREADGDGVSPPVQFAERQMDVRASLRHEDERLRSRLLQGTLGEQVNQRCRFDWWHTNNSALPA